MKTRRTGRSRRLCGSTACWLCALAVLALAVPALAAALSGAIFTTSKDGSKVNGNVYASKTDVYLNGGPHNTSSSGLPEGTYYFQVTDPSGSILLSTDPAICRQLTVDSNGRVQGYYDNGATITCAHPNGDFNAASQSTPVQLAPFSDTPNMGGEYKVYLIAQTGGTTIGTNGIAINFTDNDSKTDNFHIRPQFQCPPEDTQCQPGQPASLTVCKFWDQNVDGSHDNGEPLLPNWPITATGANSGATTQDTGSSGAGLGCTTFNFGADSLPQSVTLTEGAVSGWKQSAPLNGTHGFFTSVDGVTTINLNPGDNLTAPDIGNYCASCALTSSKDSAGSYKNTFTWTIAKDVDKTRVNQAGSTYTFSYTVNVRHDTGTISGVKVTGSIHVFNPSVDSHNNTVAVNISGVTDKLSDGTVCTVSGGEAQTLTVAQKDFAYECDLSALPQGQLDNTATVSWSGQTLSNGSNLAGGSANFTASNIQFAETKVDSSVTVTDPLGGGDLGSVSSADASPKAFTYSKTVTGTAGTCTTQDNTATFTTITSGTTGNASKTVTLCVGADLTVTKTANTSFTRTYNWTISKNVDKNKVEQAGGNVTFNYSVTASETGFVDSDWKIYGNITVKNPNDWENISAVLSDSLGTGCTINSGVSTVNVSMSGSVTVPYSCPVTSAASGTNTATATWDGGAASTPHGSMSGSAGYTFGAPTTRVTRTITVTDTFNATTTTLSSTLTASDTTPYTSQTFTYAHTVPNALGGTCKAYPNTATIFQTGASSSQTVTVCNMATGALTMGYWQNNNGQKQISNAGGSPACALTGSLLQYSPFQDLSSSATCGSVQATNTKYTSIQTTSVTAYVASVMYFANASGAAMNAMLKGQMLATALDVFFKGIGTVKIDLTQVCRMIDSGGAGTCSGTRYDASGAFGGSASLTVSMMLTYAASQSTAGGSSWYGQNKNTQQAAKDAFDEINNQVAYIAP